MKTCNVILWGKVGGGATGNSGAIVFKNSASGRKLANLYAERMKKELHFDQLALQSAIMSLAIPTYNEYCDERNDANQCYDREMTAAGHPRDNRTFEKYCILDNSYHLSLHDDSKHQYSEGDILYHGKDGDLVQRFINSWSP